MFWGLSLKANKKYTQTVQKPFHVSQAALDITNSSDDPIQVILSYEKSNYILCTLRKGKTEQVPLDLNFAEGDEVSFTSQGGGNVHLVGYFMTEPEDMFDGEEEDSDEEIDLPADLAALKGKLGKNQKAKKELNKSNTSEEASDDDDDSEDGEDDDSGDDDDDDDDDDNEEVEDDESESEEEEQPKKKQIKLDKSKESLQNGKAPSKEKKAQTPKQQQNEKPKGGEKTLQGGVRVEDINVGNGQEARPGKKVQVYYEGRLKSNNRVFDSSKQGGGFKFTLGRGEVIKGWDIGVAGMKIGGKRKITCPPNMAYGAKGSPPVIPPNSTLVFEVELKGVH